MCVAGLSELVGRSWDTISQTDIKCDEGKGHVFS